MSDSEDDVFNLSQDESDDYEPDAPKKVLFVLPDLQSLVVIYQQESTTKRCR